MPEADPAPVMEAAANGGAVADADAAAPEKLDNGSMQVAAADSEDVKTAKAEGVKESQGGAEEAETNEDNNIAKPEEGKDVKMVEAENKDEGPKEDKDENKNIDKEEESKEKEDGGSTDLEQSKANETGAADKQEEEETEEKESDEKAAANGGAAADADTSAPEKLDNGNVEVAAAGCEDVKMAKPEEGKDVKMVEAEEGKDVKMVDAENKDETPKEDKDENKNIDKKDELKEKEDGGSADLDQTKANETGAANEQEEEEAEKKESDDKKEEDAGDDDATEEKAEKDGADNQGKDSEGTDEQTSEADKVVEETPKSKKARSARDTSQGKDKKTGGSKSREAKSLLSTPSPYGTDRPQRERKTVERLVEAIEKEPYKNFVVEKGRGTPLKDIPNVANRISRRKPADLKFLHSILFGKKGRAADFKGHILQFSGFVWHESDEKMRAKAKEKLDKCVKEVLLDICWLFAIPVPKANIRKEDIVTKLLDFIAEPHGVGDSGLSDDQGSHSRKRKRAGSSSKTPDSTTKKFGGDLSSSKKSKKALELNSDEDEDDYESMKSDSEENKDEDSDVAADEHDYDSGKDKVGKKSSERNKTNKGSGNKTGAPRTISKSQIRKSSSKISKKQESPDDSAKVFSRKRKPSSKGSFAEKETKEKKSSGKKVTKGKEATTEAVRPSKEELRKTIVGILKKVDFNTATFSDILKKLGNHYEMDLTPEKEDIKRMIQDELTKISEEDDRDAGKQQRTKRVKV